MSTRLAAPTAPDKTRMSMWIPAAFTPFATLVPHDSIAPADFHALLARPLRVRWEGDQALLSALARFNRECCLGLLAAGDVELILADAPAPRHRLDEPDAQHFAPV